MHTQKISLKASSDYFVTSLCPPDTWATGCPFILYSVNPVSPFLFSSPRFRTSLLLPTSAPSGSVFQAWSPTVHPAPCRLNSKIQTSLHDGLGSLRSGPCLRFRPHLPLIHVPPSPMLSNKTKLLCQEKCEKFWNRPKIDYWIFCLVQHTGLSLSFLVLSYLISVEL